VKGDLENNTGKRERATSKKLRKEVTNTALPGKNRRGGAVLSQFNSQRKRGRKKIRTNTSPTREEESEPPTLSQT